MLPNLLLRRYGASGFASAQSTGSLRNTVVAKAGRAVSPLVLAALGMALLASEKPAAAAVIAHLPHLHAAQFRGAFWSDSSTWSSEKTAGLLARREFLEGRQELPYVLLPRHEQEHVLRSPAPVIHAAVAGFKRI